MAVLSHGTYIAAEAKYITHEQRQTDTLTHVHTHTYVYIHFNIQLVAFSFQLIICVGFWPGLPWSGLSWPGTTLTFEPRCATE